MADKLNSMLTYVHILSFPRVDNSPKLIFTSRYPKALGKF